MFMKISIRLYSLTRPHSPNARILQLVVFRISHSPTSGVSYHLSPSRYVTIPLLVVLVTICPHTRYVTIPLLVVLVTIGPLHAMLLFPY